LCTPEDTSSYGSDDPWGTAVLDVGPYERCVLMHGVGVCMHEWHPQHAMGTWYSNCGYTGEMFDTIREALHAPAEELESVLNIHR